MGKTSKNSKTKNKSKTNNKEKNLKKKKKLKHKKKIIGKGETKHYSHNQFKKSLDILCSQMTKLNQTATPRDIVKAKHMRDERLLNRDIGSICKDFTKMCKQNQESKNQETESDTEECFAAVENLSRNVSDLYISADTHQPGFKLQRWQKRKIKKKAVLSCS